MAQKTLSLVITGDAKSVKKAMRDVEQGSMSMGDAASKAGIGIGTAAKAGVAALGAAGIAAAAWGVSVASSNEQAAVSFETIMGSAEAAQSMMDDLKDFAAKTPFELPGLQNAASRLLAVGTEAEKVIPLMEAIGDATAGMGTGAEGIDRAVTALTQMQQKGKVTGEEMLQLVEAGVPAWDALATILETDVAGAQKMVSKGTVEAATLFEALETRAGPAMERLSGLMDKQSQTFEGMVSSLKDTAGQALADAFSPILKEATATGGLIEDVTGAVEQLAPAFGAVAKVGGGALSGLVDAVGPFIPVVAELAETAGEELAPIVETLGEALLALAEEVAPELLPLIGTMAEMISDNADEFEDLMDQLVPLVPMVGDLTEVMVELMMLLSATNDPAAAFDGITAAAAVAASQLQVVTDLLEVITPEAVEAGSFFDGITMEAPKAEEAIKRVVKPEPADTTSIDAIRDALVDTKVDADSLWDTFRQLITGPDTLDSQLRVESSLRALTLGLDENGATFDAHTEAGRENLALLDDARDAQADYAIALLESGMSASEVKDKMLGLTNRLQGVLDQGGATTRQMKELNDQFNLLDEDINIAFSAPGLDTFVNQTKKASENMLLILAAERESDIMNAMGGPRPGTELQGYYGYDYDNGYTGDTQTTQTLQGGMPWRNGGQKGRGGNTINIYAKGTDPREIPKRLRQLAPAVTG